MAWDDLTTRDWRRIYHGERSNLKMLDDFVKINGFNRMHSACLDSNVRRTLETGRHSYHRWHDMNNAPPELDHAKFFKNTKTGVCCLTYNPYFDADEIQEKVKTWAEKKRIGS